MNRVPALRWLVRALRFIAVVAAPVAIGCGRIVGDYEVGEEPDAGPDLGAFGKMATTVGQECTVCMRSECKNEVQTCLADASCNKLAECAFERHPDVFRCYFEAQRERFFEAVGCIDTHCREPCAFGNHWACVDGFALPVRVGPDPSKAWVSAHITKHPPGVIWQGLRVRACDATDANCEPPVAESAGLTVDGPVSLQVPLSLGAGVQSVSGFIGYFEVTSPGDPSFGTFLRYQPFPIVSDTTLFATLPATGGFLSVPPDALVGLETQDCWGGLGKRGIAFDVRTEDGKTYRTGYKRADSNEWSFELTETTDAGLALAVVPAGMIDVTALVAGNAIGKRRVRVRAGALTSVVVPPRSNSGAVY